MNRLPNIRLNPDPRIQQQKIGDSHSCVIVDNFLEDPETLIHYACENRHRFFRTEVGYPGPMLNLETSALRDFHRFILKRMGDLYSFLRGKSTVATGLTMTTLRVDELSNFQRLCHTDPRDTLGRRKYAALVYLFKKAELGGTAFYRWKKPDVVERALELELRDPAAAAEFLAERTFTFRQPPRYMTESNELAELIEVIPARFNRFVFYSGEIPHSGHITSPELLSDDFARGRLTLNCFASVLPR